MTKAMAIRLYGPDDEVLGTFERSFVPWKLLKRAIKLAKSMEGGEITEDGLDELAGLVVEVFGNQFTVEQVNEGADVGEMMAVLNTIVGRAAPAANPP